MGRLIKEAPNSGEYWTVRNQRGKRQCDKWARQDPSGRIKVTSRTLQPLNELMDALITASGDVADRKLKADAINSGGDFPLRSLKAFEGLLEQQFAVRSRAILSDESWHVLRPRQRTLELRGLALRQLYCGLCGVYTLLVLVAKSFPMSLLELLWVPVGQRAGDAARILAVFRSARCMMDDFTIDFVAVYNTVDTRISAECY